MVHPALLDGVGYVLIDPESLTHSTDQTKLDSMEYCPLRCSMVVQYHPALLKGVGSVRIDPEDLTHLTDLT